MKSTRIQSLILTQRLRWSPLLSLLLLCLSLGSFWPTKALQAEERADCFSCRIEVHSLDQATSLEGRWLFTRDDKPENALPETDTKDWVVIQAPGPWTKAYAPDKTPYRIGWYRGNFVFDESLIGKKAVFYIDAYMSKMSIYLDGKQIFDRKGHDTHQKYFSIQPVPVVFDITKTEHVFSVRIDTPLMMGVYQSPFQLREYKHYDAYINFFQIFCGELRYLFAYIFAWTGLFFLLLYFKTRYPLFLVSGLTGIGIFPFYAFPNDMSVRLFDPDTMLILHYPGIGFMALGYFWFSQFFHKFYPRIAIFNATVMGLFTAVFLYLAFDFHLGLFQIVRKALFIFSFVIATHGVVNCIIGYRKDPRIGPAIIGKVLFWASSGHDILLALGLIKSTSLIFVGTFAGTFAILLITANLFAQIFNDNEKLLVQVKLMNDGLEKTVAERTKDLHAKTQEISTILESLPQGIIEADRNLVVLDNYSQALTQILEDTDIAGRNLIDLVFKGSTLSADTISQTRNTLEMCLGESRFTFDVNTSALTHEFSKTFSSGTKILSVGWSSVCDEEDNVEKILVTLTDVTRQKKLEKESALLKLRAQIIEATLDSSGNRLVTLIRQAGQKLRNVWLNPTLANVDVAKVYRELHTLKGNSRLFELKDLSDLCHIAETHLDHFKKHRDEANLQLLEAGMSDVFDALKSLQDMIDHFSAKIKSSNRDRDAYGIAVHPKLLTTLNAHRQEVAENSKLGGLLRALHYQPAILLTTSKRDQFRPLAQNLGKPEAAFDFKVSEQLFIDPRFASTLDDMLGHMIRNSLDHGIEFPEGRQKSGKDLQGKIRIELESGLDSILFHYSDDGAGLDLFRIREKAASLGLCAADEQNVGKLVGMIFASGFSTAKNVTDVSGRGVGMDVVLTEIKEWGGQIVWLEHPERLDQTKDGRVPFHMEITFPSELGYDLAPPMEQAG